MSEREINTPQQTETPTKAEAEKAAEEERRAAQEILEKLHDPFTNHDWLVHTTPIRKLKRILQQGIFSDDFVERARQRTDIKIIKSESTGYQLSNEISACPKLNDERIRWWFGAGTSKAVSIMFVPLLRDGKRGILEEEKIAKIRVAPRRFKMLVLYQGDNQRGVILKVIPIAVSGKLPVIDRDFNLYYPMKIPKEALQKITIPSLRELAKTLGIEKLRAMSIEEIKSAASALTLPK